jgi:hypothetical protein
VLTTFSSRTGTRASLFVGSTGRQISAQPTRRAAGCGGSAGSCHDRARAPQQLDVGCDDL